MRYAFLCIIIFLMGCNRYNPETEKKKSHPSHRYTYTDTSNYSIRYYETDYVPVYSDIYHRNGTRRFKLTATISIRNTSLTNSAFILNACYYDSYGKKLTDYVDSTILLSPLESIEFVVDEEEQIGGAGANFIINWAATRYRDQLWKQSVMIGTYGQQGISFITDTKVISRQVIE